MLSDAEAEDSCSEEESQSGVEWRFDSFYYRSNNSNQSCKWYISSGLAQLHTKLVLSRFTCNNVKGRWGCIFHWL